MAAPELSSEQKVAYFQEVTGLSDQSQCIQALEAHGWDLDAAVATILAIRDRDDAGPSSLNEKRSQYDGAGPSFHAGSSDDTGYDSRNYESGSIQPAQAPNIIWRTLSLPGAVARGGLGLAFGAIGLGLWAASGVLSSVGSAASRALGGDAARQLPAETEARKFIRSFESEYGSEHPDFQDLSFMQAVKLAQEQFKFLLVYLHSPEHVNTPVSLRLCLHFQTC
jgi:FAS-associated factor 2